MFIHRHKLASRALSAIAAVAVALAAGPRGDAEARRPEAHLQPGWVDQQRLDNAAGEPQNWMTYGGTYAEQRYSTLHQIDEGSIGRLGLAWSYEFDTNRGQEATPLVVDGVMYVSTAWSKVFALDARTGRKLWAFDPKVPGTVAFRACCDLVNRGVAVWKGRVYVGTIDGRLIAIDARSGRQAWSVQTTDRGKPYTITGAPRVFRDKVIIGNGGAEFGVRGYVTAYDTRTGKLAWRFYTVPNARGVPDRAASDPVMAKAAATWFGTGWHETGGGGTAWDSIVYDPALNQVYIGVGNGSPWSRVARSDGHGDNLFLASIVAVDADTGAYRWHYQATPGDSYDFTSTQQITLARLTIGGVDRDVLMQAPKNGMFYVIDRRTGKLLSARNYAQVTWTTGVDPATGRPQFTENAFYDKGPKEIMPWSFGAHSWQPMSFSPRTGLVYIPVMQHPASYMQDPAYRFTPGRMNLAIAAGPPSTAEIGGALIAWDPVAQREVWRVRQPEIWNGGALSTAANLVFAGNAHGEFSAYRATDGQRLWMYRQGAAIMGGPITYSVGGVQYVAVIAGYGGGQPLMIADMSRPRKVQPMGRMLVFRLDGKAVIQDEELAVPPPNPPDESFTPQQIATGAGLYYRHCIFCHGGSVLPDLRRAGPLRDGKVWNQIVIGGLLSANGMDSFAQWLSAADAEAIRAYVGTEARELAESDAKRGAVR